MKSSLYLAIVPAFFAVLYADEDTEVSHLREERSLPCCQLQCSCFMSSAGRAKCHCGRSRTRRSICVQCPVQQSGCQPSCQRSCSQTCSSYGMGGGCQPSCGSSCAYTCSTALQQFGTGAETSPLQSFPVPSGGISSEILQSGIDGGLIGGSGLISGGGLVGGGAAISGGGVTAGGVGGAQSACESCQASCLARSLEQASISCQQSCAGSCGGGGVTGGGATTLGSLGGGIGGLLTGGPQGGIISSGAQGAAFAGSQGVLGGGAGVSISGGSGFIPSGGATMGLGPALGGTSLLNQPIQQAPCYPGQSGGCVGGCPSGFQICINIMGLGSSGCCRR